MKPFNSFIAPRLEEFIAYRKNLGLRCTSFRSYLLHFDNYIIEKNAAWVDFIPPFFLHFQERISGENSTVNKVVSAVHSFFQFLIRYEYYDENPLQYIPARPENRFIPFIFTPQEVEELLLIMQAGIRRSKDTFFLDYTVYTAFLLISRCGLRISEPLHMKISSYRPGERTIYIEKTKFYKDRLIPIPQAAAMELDNYLVVRRIFGDAQNNFLFPGKNKDQGLKPYIMYPVFHRAISEIGKARRKEVIGTTTFGAPTVHSMRHSFAVNTLKNIRVRGDDPQKALPVLSAYMGHHKYCYTAQYLKMIDPEQRNNLVDFTRYHKEDL